MARRPTQEPDFDRELADLPAELRWREWKARVEAVLFAAAKPVGRETLARVVGQDCALGLLLDDLKEDLRGRPVELVRAGESYTLHTRPAFGSAIRVALDIPPDAKQLTKPTAAKKAGSRRQDSRKRAVLYRGVKIIPKTGKRSPIARIIRDGLRKKSQSQMTCGDPASETLTVPSHDWGRLDATGRSRRGRRPRTRSDRGMRLRNHARRRSRRYSRRAWGSPCRRPAP
jgi:hypothetical protein